MGSWPSRQLAGVEEVDIVSNLAYKYPPRSGKYARLLASFLTGLGEVSLDKGGGGQDRPSCYVVHRA